MTRTLQPVDPRFDSQRIHQTKDPSWYTSRRNRTRIETDEPIDASHFVYVEETKAALLFIDGDSFDATGHALRDLYPIDQLDLAFARGIDVMQVCLWFPHQTVRFIGHFGPHDWDIELSDRPLHTKGVN